MTPAESIPLHSPRDLVVVRHRLRLAGIAAGVNRMVGVRLGTAVSVAARAVLTRRGPCEVIVTERADRLVVSLEGADWSALTHVYGSLIRVEPDGISVALGPEDRRVRVSALQSLQVSERELHHARARLEEANARLEEVNETLARRRRQLERANRDLEMIAAAAAHDLKEPLQVIRLFSTALLQHPDAKEPAAVIRDAAERMASMLAGLMSLARVGDPDPSERARVSQVMDGVMVDLSSVRNETGGAIHVVGDAEVGMTEAHLRGLLQNLVGNGLKYRREDVPPAVIVRSEAVGNHLRLSVEDNGRGIPEPARKRLFKLFERLDRDDDVRGTGVGLALVHRIVEAYNGTITVHPQSPGTVFRITLPKPGPSSTPAIA